MVNGEHPAQDEIRSKSYAEHFLEVKLKESELIPPGCRGEHSD